MAAKIEFTAVHEGHTYTRTSGTMPYVAITVGSQVQWHKTMASAAKASTSREQTYSTGVPATIVPVKPTAIKGKLGEWMPDIDGWGEIPASAFAELVAAKNKGKVTASKHVANNVTVYETADAALDAIEAEFAADLQPEAVITMADGEVTAEEIEPEPLMTVDAAVDAEIARRAEAAEATVKLRITSRVSAWLVTVERTEVEAQIIAKMAAARKRTDGSVTIATTQVERDTLLAHCSDMETANLEGAGFHDLDRLNKVNAARWLIGKIAEAEA
ncbi:hypothetical protein PHELEMICH_90 [Mycobacterium phage Phelemich]|nr:hypothetical protein N847_gp90 [Mycobacterium phage Phelemich]AGT14004.1 hypothetical protein PHELEMICH_90 [Mycobacterium phage Phelemich]